MRVRSSIRFVAFFLSILSSWALNAQDIEPLTPLAPLGTALQPSPILPVAPNNDPILYSGFFDPYLFPGQEEKVKIVLPLLDDLMKSQFGYQIAPFMNGLDMADLFTEFNNRHHVRLAQHAAELQDLKAFMTSHSEEQLTRIVAQKKEEYALFRGAFEKAVEQAEKTSQLRADHCLNRDIFGGETLCAFSDDLAIAAYPAPASFLNIVNQTYISPLDASGVSATDLRLLSLREGLWEDVQKVTFDSELRIELTFDGDPEQGEYIVSLEISDDFKKEVSVRPSADDLKLYVSENFVVYPSELGIRDVEE